MAKSKPIPHDPIPARSASEGETVIVETIDDTNKAVIDDSSSRSPSGESSTSLSPRGVLPQPLDLRIAAMLGMGLDVVRERIAGKDQAALLKLVEAKNHPDLAAMLAVPARSASEGS